jgi:hypothetical protein
MQLPFIVVSASPIRMQQMKPGAGTIKDSEATNLSKKQFDIFCMPISSRHHAPSSSLTLNP